MVVSDVGKVFIHYVEFQNKIYVWKPKLIDILF